MKVAQIAENGWQLTQLGFVNCYLVREGDGFSLIDTGVLSGGRKAIVEAARALGGTIRRILLTHAHGDHVGGVDGLIAAIGTGNVELISNARSLPLLQKPPVKTLQSGEAVGTVKGSLPGIGSKPTKLVNDGELYGVFRCIETPGHIPGHIAYLDERDGTLYAGDALVGVGRLTVSGYSPWYFPLPNFATWNKGIARASAEKLLGYSTERFACGHGGVKDGGAAALRAALGRAKRY